MAIYIDRNAPESGIASLLAMQGRGGDTELVHMTKPEVKMLMNTGLMSLNNETGLPEFFKGKDFLKFALPIAAGIAFPALLGPSIGSIFGTGAGAALAGNAIAGGLGTAAAGMLTGQDPADALMSGLLSGGMSYGLGSAFPKTFGVKGGVVGDVTPASHMGALEASGGMSSGPFAGPTDYITESTATSLVPTIDFPPPDYPAYIKAPPLPVATPSIGGLSYGMGPQALAASGAQTGSLGGLTNTPLMHSYNPAPRVLPEPSRVLPSEIFTTNKFPGADRAFNNLIEGMDPEFGMTELVTVENPQVFPGIPRYTTADTLGSGRVGIDRVLPEPNRVFPSTSPVNSDESITVSDSAFRGGDRSLTPSLAKAATVTEESWTDRFKEKLPQSLGEFGERVWSKDSILPAVSSLGTGLLTGAFDEEVEEQTIEIGGKSYTPRELEYTYNLAPNQLEGLSASEIRALLEKGNLGKFYEQPSSGEGVFRPVAQGGLIGLADGGNPDFEGQVIGHGHGMQDNVLMPIKEKGGIAAVSPDEYVVPADVMSMIGNGSADSGAKAMDSFIADFRTMKYGRPEQPPEINPKGALQSLMKT